MCLREEEVSKKSESLLMYSQWSQSDIFGLNKLYIHEQQGHSKETEAPQLINKIGLHQSHHKEHEIQSRYYKTASQGMPSL